MKAIFAACLAFALTVRADEPALRRELDRVFSDWRSAIATHNLAAWQQSTASSRQNLTRNLIVSQKQSFPQALFDFPLRAPETSTLRFIKAEEKGATANLIYFGKVDFGIPDAGEIPELILVLKFINESSHWKFDTLKLINLDSAPEVLASLKNGGNNAMLNTPELSPSGVVPPTPKACPVPDHIAALQITSLGYATGAKVNGFSLPVVSDGAEQHLIIGGLKDGENALTLDIKPTQVAEGSARHLEVNAIVITGNEKKPSIRVFNWKPEGQTVPEVSDQKIIVNKITMRGD
ncbi:MAG: hypothetical protein WCN98_09515 [Verrucomicrobiaceae bacterium]